MPTQKEKDDKAAADKAAADREEKEAKARARSAEMDDQSDEQAEEQAELNPEDPGHVAENIDHRPSNEPLAQPGEDLQVQEPAPNPNELEGKTVVLSETVNMKKAKSDSVEGMIALINIQTGEEIDVTPAQWEENRAMHEAGGFRLKDNPTGKHTLTPEAEPWQVSQGTGFVRGTRRIPGQ